MNKKIIIIIIIPEDGLQLDPERVFACLQKNSSVLMGGLVLPAIACQQTTSADCNNITTLIRSLKLMPAQQSTV